jgi:hypothetical protein
MEIPVFRIFLFFLFRDSSEFFEQKFFRKNFFAQIARIFSQEFFSKNSLAYFFLIHSLIPKNRIAPAISFFVLFSFKALVDFFLANGNPEMRFFDLFPGN